MLIICTADNGHLINIYPYLLSSETTAKGTGLVETAGKEDPVELELLTQTAVFLCDYL